MGAASEYLDHRHRQGNLGAFEATGTSFARYVARRRLLQCRAALGGSTGVNRSVADIAFGWGFNSLATFYRAFEREFGSPPTALRAMAAAGHAD